MTKTTLEQLAEKAQVSISTVSRVLNGKKGVNEGTRRRVLSILAGANYGTANAVAAARNNRVIGVLVPEAAQHWGLHSNFIREGLQAVTDVGRQSNYITMVGAFSPNLGDRAEDRMILDREFAGVLLFRMAGGTIELLSLHAGAPQNLLGQIFADGAMALLIILAMTAGNPDNPVNAVPLTIKSCVVNTARISSSPPSA